MGRGRDRHMVRGPIAVPPGFHYIGANFPIDLV